ncbi:hypothetical protein [Isoptericola cucumis]|uniref:DivIVA domain-containing protein n=1 Tax=Isoptericola cucumis TaxID=1776856 RepID=A0ABQ2B8K9_9MICO|nr:hypothetical protein [Isoptericola cucumis]GGI08644.1 hypothetical protein GCM10007368_22190 [Isoptericola cucumis]
MKTYVARIARRVAPRTVRNLEALSDLTADHGEGPLRFVAYERELQDLRREVDALRRDSRRVAELYDVVFEQARRDAAERGVAPTPDREVTDRAVAALEERLESEKGRGTATQEPGA